MNFSYADVEARRGGRGLQVEKLPGRKTPEGESCVAHLRERCGWR
jgi:hypothetical protein